MINILMPKNHIPLTDLESNSRNVQVFRREPITKLLDSAGDLVKVHSLRPVPGTVNWVLCLVNLHIYLLWVSPVILYY